MSASESPEIRVHWEDDLTYWAWTIIANVSEGDWTKQPQEWQDAAARWRDAWHKALEEALS